MENHYKAILLVLASNNSEVYNEFKKIYQSYLYENPNIKVLFVYGKCDLYNRMDYDLVFDDVEENYYPGMITKTIRAFEYINQKYIYDFLIRTNLSTFWDFDRLTKRLDTLPTIDCLTGTLRSCKYKGQSSPQYIAGVNLILSYNLVEQLIENQNEICSWDLPEDWSLSQFFINKKIMPEPSCPGAIHHMDKFSMFDEEKIFQEIESAKKANHDHFRLKNKNRDIDVKIAKVLLKEYYDKTLL